jgi:hypothetical protein
MTDDILTRLRGESLVQTKPCIRGGCCEICESILDSSKEAAAEIERLRKELADTRSDLRRVEMQQIRAARRWR